MSSNTPLTTTATDHRHLLALVVAIALLVATWAHWSTLTQPYVVNNDAHQHTFWMHSLEDPELFEGDLLAHYSLAYQPPGYVWLFRSLSLVVNPLTAARFLPLLLFALSAGLLLLVVRSFSGRFEALLSCSIFLASPLFLQKMAGAHPRAFATPFLLLTLLLLFRRRHRSLGLLLVMQSLFYPMIFLLSSATSLLGLLFGQLRLVDRRLRPVTSWRVFVPVSLGVLLGCGALVTRYWGPEDPQIGSLVTRAEMEASPEFFAGGRARHLPQRGLQRNTEQVIRQGLPNTGRVLGIDTFNRMPGWQFRFLLLLLLVTIFLAVRRRGFLPAPWLALAISSVALYLLADYLLLRLFFPKRYVMYSISLLVVVAVALAAGALLRLIPAGWARQTAQALSLTVVALHLPGMAGAGLDDYSPRGELYRFAATLPKDAILAGHPTSLEGIPLFSGRRVLATLETSTPYYTGYWQQLKDRLYPFFEAYYGSDPSALASWLKHQDIDYLVVDESTFDKEFLARPRRGAYFQPFGAYIDTVVAGSGGFAALEIPEERRTFESSDGRLWMVATADLLASPDSPVPGREEP